MRGLEYCYQDWMNKYYWDYYYSRQQGFPNDGPVAISDAEGTFLDSSLRLNGRDYLARFRMTMKVHKDPWKMRPIVACAGTFMNDWSRWLDYQLQKCKPFIPTYLRDRQQVLDELQKLKLSSNARIFTADANSMYNNIDTEHAIIVIGAWLDEMGLLIGEEFPVEAIKVAVPLYRM